MKIRRKGGSPTGGVPAKMGGYNYSTDKSQNTQFNQGLVPRDPGAGSSSYDYSAKGRAARMYKARGNRPAGTSSGNYGTAQNKARIMNRVNKGL